MNPVDPGARWPFPVVHEDDCYIVFDKPPGILVIPTPGKEKTTMVSALNPVPHDTRGYRVHPCHRLDRDTSGLIIFAKGKKNQQRMMGLFHHQRVVKKYIALVHGHLTQPRGAISKPVKGREKRIHQRNARPKHAITRYVVVERKPQYTIVEAYPQTGRTNQIRIHFSSIGHPLVGERKYAFARDFDLTFTRTALHASDITWVHPVSGRTVSLHAPLPGDLKRFISRH